MNMHANESVGTVASLRRLRAGLMASMLGLTLLAGCGGRTVQTAGQPSLPAAKSSASASLSVASHVHATTTKPQPAVTPILFIATPVAHVQATQSAPPACHSSDLDLGEGQPVSEPTGQHTIALTLTNRSPQACSLFGYPQVTLLDGSGQALPFEYRHQGDQVVTSATPTTFDLAPGTNAYVTINKYRCDLGDQSLAERLLLYLPGDRTSLSISLPSSSGVFGFCGANDPGSIVSISPLEATFRETLSH